MVDQLEHQPLLPLTKLLLVASGVVPFIFGCAQVFATDFVNDVLWPEPFQPIGEDLLLFLAASYFALTIGAAYAYFKNDWRTATGFLVFAVPYVALSIVATLVNFLREGVPVIAWVYVFLAALYVPLSVWTWKLQTQRSMGLREARTSGFLARLGA